MLEIEFQESEDCGLGEKWGCLGAQTPLPDPGRVVDNSLRWNLEAAAQIRRAGPGDYPGKQNLKSFHSETPGALQNHFEAQGMINPGSLQAYCLICFRSVRREDISTKLLMIVTSGSSTEGKLSRTVAKNEKIYWKCFHNESRWVCLYRNALFCISYGPWSSWKFSRLKLPTTPVSHHLEARYLHILCAFA